MEIILRDEAAKQGLKRFFTGEPCVRGHVSERYVNGRACIACQTRPEKLTHNRKWAKTNRAAHNERNRRTYWRDPERTRELKRANSAKHPETRRASRARRRARERNAIPIWQTASEAAAIKEFYKNCPAGYEVDHIYPLKGENVCGLHVLANLQYLTIFDNRSKANRVSLD